MNRTGFSRGLFLREDGFAVQNGSPSRRRRAAIAGDLAKPGGRFVLALQSGPDRRWLIAADLDNSGPRSARRAKSVGSLSRRRPAAPPSLVQALSEALRNVVKVTCAISPSAETQDEISIRSGLPRCAYLTVTLVM